MATKASAAGEYQKRRVARRGARQIGSSGITFRTVWVNIAEQFQLEDPAQKMLNESTGRSDMRLTHLLTTMAVLLMSGGNKSSRKSIWLWIFTKPSLLSI